MYPLLARMFSRASGVRLYRVPFLAVVLTAVAKQAFKQQGYNARVTNAR